MPGNLLTRSQTDSVRILSKVRKALYVMQSLDGPEVFRFGCIGGRHPGLFNTAIRRLGQNLHPDEEIWHYVAICELPQNWMPEQIRELEKNLKARLVGDQAPGAHEQEGNKDKFSGGDLPTVLRIFKQVIGR